MRMMNHGGHWYHILQEIKTPFYREDNFVNKIDYIILEDNVPKILRPYEFKERIITQGDLSKMISKIESTKWRSEERRISYLNHYKMLSQMLRDHIINEVLTNRCKNYIPIC